MVKDPVCGATVDEKTASFKSLYSLKVYYFDSEACKVEFDKNPEKYKEEENAPPHHASHYGGYCPTPGCSKPQRGAAWYFYIGLLILISLLILSLWLLQ